ncbi:FAD/NAD-P-binding domain-containing protein [Mycena pura]|uniref:FAD/NAD-P-binding domain-containing protein n=1 Tax=Mycena pura TaxID=153505 RepID=A0AAD6UUY4_9AGAR|nr:FAD/NAD-P-binding domain-containing protein [Mycena pura]
MARKPQQEPVAIIGSGAAGLITAYTLTQDGFSRVQILTSDKTAGGVWSSERVYPGLQINNVHGEYQFSAMEMPKSANGRVTGYDMCAYMQAFSSKFLSNVIRFEVDVVSIRRDEATSVWFVTIDDLRTAKREVLEFARVILCTGGCNTPRVPESLSPATAAHAGFRGLVIHSKNFASQLKTVLETVPPRHLAAPKSIVVVGGGKSAQDMAACLANMDRKVTIVFETADAFLASPKPLPGFIRKSRLLSIMAGHVVLRSRLERFLHATWLGNMLTRFFWVTLSQASLLSAGVMAGSSLRHVHPLFWTTSVNDEGVPQAHGFHKLVRSGRIEAMAPARVHGFGSDGRSVVLSDGRTIAADVVLLATGYTSSWTNIFHKETAERLGLDQHAPGLKSSLSLAQCDRFWPANRPAGRPAVEQRTSGIYNGIVPSKNIARGDFAINGAIFTTNVGYTWEVVAHWISSYFLGDVMRIPATPAEAHAAAEHSAAWLRWRFPDALQVNESYASLIAFWTWPQFTDQLLEEMGLKSMRSGGNWLTWPFMVIKLKEISTLKEERKARRAPWPHKT